MTKTFQNIIDQRRAENDKDNDDILQTLMTSVYKNNEPMTDSAIAHLMIAVLMGGQHTSSTTTSWILFETSRCPEVM